MPEKVYWFPSQEGTYPTPAGNVRVKIYHSAESGSNTDIGMSLRIIGKIKYPLASSIKDQKLTLASTSLVFYNENNIFETILDVSKREEIFVDIDLDGMIIFHGRAQWDFIKKTEYEINEVGEFVYKKIELPFEDKISFLAQKTMSDIAFTDGSVADLLRAMADLLNLDDGLFFNYYVTEGMGNTYGLVDTSNPNYDWFRIHSIDSDANLMDVLKALCFGFAYIAFSYGGEFIFFPIGGAQTTEYGANDISSISDITINIQNKYVWIHASKLWQLKEYSTQIVVGEVDALHEKEYGTHSNDAKNNFELDITSLMTSIYIPAPDTGLTSYPADVPDDSDYTFVSYILGGFHTHLLESGMWFRADYNVGQGQYELFSIVTDAPSDTMITFFDVREVPSLYKYFSILRYDPNYDFHKLYKISKIVDKTAELYDDFFQDDDSVTIKVKNRHIPRNDVLINGLTYKVESCEFDIMTNLTSLTVLTRNTAALEAYFDDIGGIYTDELGEEYTSE